MKELDLFYEGYERGVAEGKAYKEAYFQLVQHLANFTAMQAPPPILIPAPRKFKHVCNLWANPDTLQYEVDHCTHPLDELIPAFIET